MLECLRLILFANFLETLFGKYMSGLITLPAKNDVFDRLIGEKNVFLLIMKVSVGVQWIASHRICSWSKIVFKIFKAILVLLYNFVI